MLDLPKTTPRVARTTLPSGGTLLQGGKYDPRLTVLGNKGLFGGPCQHTWVAVGDPVTSRQSKCAHCGAIG